MEEETSNVWHHFRKLTREEKQGEAFANLAPRNEPAVCLHCHKQVKRNDGSTKYMWSHLTDSFAKDGHNLSRNVLDSLRSPPSVPLATTFFDKKPQKPAAAPTVPTQDFHRLALKAVLGANLPFTVFENPAMVALLCAVAPNYSFPTAKVLKRLCRDYFAVACNCPFLFQFTHLWTLFLTLAIRILLRAAPSYSGTFDIFSKGGSSYFSMSALVILSTDEVTQFMELFLAMKYLDVDKDDHYKTAERQKDAVLVRSAF